jgi:peroxiredoxin
MQHLLTAALALAWLAILPGSWLGWQLLRQNGRLLLRLEALEQRLDEMQLGGPAEPAGLPIGSVAPDFELPDLAGEPTRLAQNRGQPLLLIFFNPACGYCRDLAPKLATLTRPADTLSHPMGEGGGRGRPLPIIISTGETEKNREFFAEHKVVSPVLLQKGMEVAAAYQANGTPSGYLISSEGKIASELAVGTDALLALANECRSSRREEAQSSVSPPSVINPHPGDPSLVTSSATSRFSNRSLARSKIKRDGLKAGTQAPSFRLPRLDGSELALEDLRGKLVLLVFSSPHCGPCDTLAPRLDKFHREHPELELLMISRGEPKENRAKVKEHGLKFPVVLQQQWEISRRYAMFATPSAYFINEAGVIAHDVAVGADAILELMVGADRVAREKQPD